MPKPPGPPLSHISALLAVILLLILSGCGTPTPAEELIRQQLDSLEEAVETKEVDTALDIFNTNFTSEKGHNHQWIKRTLLLYNLRHERISLTISQLDIGMLDEKTARASFNVLATGGAGLIPDQGAIYKVETEWRDEGEWQIVYGKWKKAFSQH